MKEFLALFGVVPIAWDDGDSSSIHWYFVYAKTYSHPVIILNVPHRGYKLAAARWTLTDASQRPWDLWNDPEARRLSI